MSEEQTGGQQGNGGSADGNQNQNPDNTKTEAQRLKEHADRLLAEKKKVEADKKALQEQLDKIERERLEKEGKHSEVIEKLKKELEGKDGDNKNLKSKVVTNAVKATLRVEAEKAGLNVPFEHFEKLVDKNQISVDDELNVSTEDAAKAVNDLKAQMPALFKAKASIPNNLNAKDGENGHGKSEPKPVEKMTDAEWATAFAKVLK